MGPAQSWLSWNKAKKSFPSGHFNPHPTHKAQRGSLMTSSRTGLTPHLRFRKAVLTRDRRAGIKKCPFCDVTLDYDIGRKPNSAEPDHVVAIARGGTNDPANGRTICRKCNQSKGDKPTPPRKPKPFNPTDEW